VRQHRAQIQLGAAAFAVALCACGSETVVRPNPQASSVGSPRGLSLGADTTLTLGDTARFQVVNSSGAPVPGIAIQWGSSAPQVASVLAGGLVVASQLGSAVITAQTGSSVLSRNVTVSLPGGRIVFFSQTPQAGLYGVRPDGSGRFQVAAPLWAVYSDLSPDGRWIVYAGTNTNLGRALVGVQPVDGSETRILFDQPGEAGGVSWSPVGGRIVFAYRTCTACLFQLYAADTAGTSVTQITFGPVEAAFPAWSPDGTRIAFSTRANDRDVWIVNANGTSPVQVTGAGASETHPAWISNTRLVIARITPGNPYDLYLVNTDGTDLVQLTSGQGSGWPHPSPDRRWIVFWTSPSNSLSIVRVDGRGPFAVPTATLNPPFPSWGREPQTQASSLGSERGLTLGADTTITVGDAVRFQVVNPGGKPVPSPAIRWASSEPLVARVLPDGTIETLQPGHTVITATVGSQSLARTVTVSLPGGRIVFTSQTPQAGLYGVRPDGTGRFRIAAPSWAAYSDVSPDGRWIVFGGNPSGHGRVTVQRVDGSEARDLFNEPGNVAGVSWSPVGGQIAFTAGPCSSPGLCEHWLHVVDAAGGVSWERIMTSGPGTAAFPAWSPDGTHIAFSTFPTNPNGVRDVWIVNADGTNPVVVPGDVNASETHPAWISNTRLVIARSMGIGPPYDLYLVNTDGTNLVPLTSDPGSEGWPHLSPDRRWIVFWVSPDPTSLSIVRVDGLGPFHVPTATFGQLFPSWGPEP